MNTATLRSVLPVTVDTIMSEVRAIISELSGDEDEVIGDYLVALTCTARNYIENYDLS